MLSWHHQTPMGMLSTKIIVKANSQPQSNNLAISNHHTQILDHSFIQVEGSVLEKKSPLHLVSIDKYHVLLMRGLQQYLKQIFVVYWSVKYLRRPGIMSTQFINSFEQKIIRKYCHECGNKNILCWAIGFQTLEIWMTLRLVHIPSFCKINDYNYI